MGELVLKRALPFSFLLSQSCSYGRVEGSDVLKGGSGGLPHSPVVWILHFHSKGHGFQLGTKVRELRSHVPCSTAKWINNNNKNKRKGESSKWQKIWSSRSLLTWNVWPWTSHLTSLDLLLKYDSDMLPLPDGLLRFHAATLTYRFGVVFQNGEIVGSFKRQLESA